MFPFEAMKLLISDAANLTSDTFKEEVEEVDDVSRAYFEAEVKASRGTGRGGHVMEITVWNSRRSTQKPKRSPEIQAVARPCCGKRIFQYMHIKIMVHRDDFGSSGTRSSLKVVREQLAKRFEVKTKVVGR